MYDLVIIGMGPSGVSAAIYAKRAGMKVLCLDKSMIGGELNFIDSIDNYLGFSSITGPELAYKMMEQLQALSIDFCCEEVLDINVGDVKQVVTKKNVYETKYVLIATGRVSVSLGLEHEDELLGKGLSHCALCDGAFFKDKDVAVLGGGNSALQEALYLANICKSVIIIHRRDVFRADNEFVEKVNKRDNIKVIYSAVVSELLVENGCLSGIVLNNGERLMVSGLFTYIGYKPGTRFTSSLPIFDSDGYIIVDKNQETSVSGIFAAGDIVKKDVYQIVTAASEGAIAATYMGRIYKD